MEKILLSKRTFRSPDTNFHADGKPITLNGKGSTVLNFWQWAFSMFEDNTIRGTLGQYIVAWAIGADNIIHDNWQAYDLLAPNGKKIEVKTTAYTQIWDYGKRKNPLFVIKPTRSYTHEKGFEEKSSYNADVYVLCYYSWQDNSTMDVLNIDHWRFWIFSLKNLLTILDGKKSISVKKLQELGFDSLNASELKSAILAI